MQIPLNLLRILATIVWTVLVGSPVVGITYVTFWLGRSLRLLGRDHLYTDILTWNAQRMSWVGKNLWSPALLGFSGVTTWSSETTPIDWSRSYVVCSNHASVFDILALFRVLPGPVRFVAKRELTYWPIIGWSLRPAGQIIVDRQRRDQALHSMEEATRHRIHGQVIFFVEGTRSRDGSLQSFKRGAFHFAISNQMPILPVAIVGSFATLARLPWWRLHPGRKVGVVFGTPIEPVPGARGDASNGVEDLMRETREQMEGLLRRFGDAEDDSR